MELNDNLSVVRQGNYGSGGWCNAIVGGSGWLSTAWADRDLPAVMSVGGGSAESPPGSLSASSCVTFQEAAAGHGQPVASVPGTVLDPVLSQFIGFGSGGLQSPATEFDWTLPLLSGSGSVDGFLNESMSSCNNHSTYNIHEETIPSPYVLQPSLLKTLPSQPLPGFNHGSGSGILPPLQFAGDGRFWTAPCVTGLSVRNNPRLASPAAPNSPQPSLLPPIGGSSTTVGKKKQPSGGSGGGERPPKKARLEMPSPLPAFKVRKEKLGERITALQQLVSPFGKTDTASVLTETIDYIMFLHEQVGVLSTPYLKDGYELKHSKCLSKKPRDTANGSSMKDLKSRGLCLVPISSTFAAATDTSIELWAPMNFGASFRY